MKFSSVDFFGILGILASLEEWDSVNDLAKEMILCGFHVVSENKYRIDFQYPNINELAIVLAKEEPPFLAFSVLHGKILDDSKYQNLNEIENIYSNFILEVKNSIGEIDDESLEIREKMLDFLGLENFHYISFPSKYIIIALDLNFEERPPQFHFMVYEFPKLFFFN